MISLGFQATSMLFQKLIVLKDFLCTIPCIVPGVRTGPLSSLFPLLTGPERHSHAAEGNLTGATVHVHLTVSGVRIGPLQSLQTQRCLFPYCGCWKRAALAYRKMRL